MSSIFCDACRDALLERSAQITQEEQELVRAGSREGGTGELLASAQAGAAMVGSLEEPELFSAETEEERCWPRADEKGGRPFETSGIQMVEMVEEAVDDMDETDQQSGKVSATHVLAVPLPGRRTLPKKVRRALLIFCIVGALALLTDGVLLALSILRHHGGSVATHYDQEGFMRQLMPTTGASPVISTVGAHQFNQAGALLLSSSRLVFTVTQGQTSSVPQTVTFSGGSQTTFSWQIVPEQTLPTWLHLSATKGNATAGVIPAVMVSVEPAQLAPGSYTAPLQVKAFDSHGKVLLGSPATLVVVLNVRTPCTVNVAPGKLTFASVLVSGPSPQTLTLTESGGCTFPVSWQVSSDASWIILSRASGSDTGSGASILVQASSDGKLIGSYTAHLTLTASDGSGGSVTVSPTVVTATLTVIG
jgi:hypothetical protein